jgi:hypothetical protein
MARRYYVSMRSAAEADPVFRQFWEDGAKDELPRARAWLQRTGPAITAQLLRGGIARSRGAR